MKKKTILILLTNILNLISTTALSFFITYAVVNNFGSEMNGIFQTTNQFVNLFLFIEGGFVISAVVKLYRYVELNNFNMINEIVVSIKIFLKKVSNIFAVTALIFSLIYVPFIKSSISLQISYTLFFLSILNTFIILLNSYNTSIFEANQDEYFLRIISTCSNVFSIILIYISLISIKNILVIKGITILSTVLNSIFVIMVRKNKYPYLIMKKNQQLNTELLKDSSSVMVQKLASIINQSLDIVLLSVTGNIMYSSIYGIYNLIFNFAKTLGDYVAASPINGIGKLLNTNRNEAIRVFGIYEFIVNITYIILISLSITLSIPFIKLYVKTLDTGLYLNREVILLFSYVIFFNTLNRANSYVINLSGNFDMQKRIVLISTLINLTLSILLVWRFNIFGILFATLCSYLFLVPLNIYFCSKKILLTFSMQIVYKYAKFILLFVILSSISSFISTQIVASGYIMLIAFGLVSALFYVMFALIYSLIFFRKETNLICNQIGRKV